MRLILFAAFVVTVPLFVVPLSAQDPTISGGTPGVMRPGPQEGCPLRTVKARIMKVSPQGELVLESKGKLVVGKITDQTRFSIPGYDRSELRKGANVQLEPNSLIRARICERNGEVYHLKVLSGVKQKKDDKDKKD